MPTVQQKAQTMLWQLSNNNLILQRDGVPVHFAHTVRDCLNVNFPGSWIGRGGPITWPPCSPDLTPLNFLLWGYVKDKVYSQRVNRLDGLKGRMTAPTANVTNEMLQRAWQGVNFKWDAGFEVLTAVVMKSSILWDITPCSPLRVNRRFGGEMLLRNAG
jgi:hypothetical protein